MTLTNHAITGIAVAVAVQKPVLALPIALLSHFVIDAIPHFSQRQRVNSKEFATGDALTALVVTLVLAFTVNDLSTWLIITCAILGTLPDWVWGWRYYRLRTVEAIFKEPMSALSRWHIKIQWSETKQGIYTELLWFSFVLAYIFSK